jgi:hypothetical protein
MRLGTLGRVMVLVTVALTVGAGLCVFDVGHTESGDLCTSGSATTIGLLLAIPLVLTGRFIPGFVPAYHHYPPDLPTPPPKA